MRHTCTCITSYGKINRARKQSVNKSVVSNHEEFTVTGLVIIGLGEQWAGGGATWLQMMDMQRRMKYYERETIILAWCIQITRFHVNNPCSIILRSIRPYNVSPEKSPNRPTIKTRVLENLRIEFSLSWNRVVKHPGLCNESSLQSLTF
jgi:hypothetical protein